ncbi:MATE family efflux transporter [uncultured Brachyspira sp.]|uniref:MATE family efflux transporter n=1 Tax=uncultured Brachyspira sp. TaxID=221953 RepID=UPI00260F16AF|nr:MATE family efflux transporter [uncultured Brachyspira sp.]
MNTNSIKANNKITMFGNFDFYKLCISIAVPVMLQQLIMGMVSLIDNFMVAELGDIKMAAVNVSNQMNFIYLVILNTCYGAGGIYMAQNNGADNKEGMQQAFRFKVILPLTISIAYMILMLVNPEIFMRLMTHGNASQEEILISSTKYMSIIAFTFIPISISGAIGTSYREIGKPHIPLIISVIATFCNATGNYILIYGNFGAPRLEEKGAAIATLIARIIEMVLFIVYIKLHKEKFYVRTREILKVKLSVFYSMLSKSSLIFLSEISWGISEMFMTALYNSRGGAETVAGMASGFTIANIFFLVFQGIFVSTMVVVGGTLGRGELDDARKKAKWIRSGSIVAGIIIGLIEMSSIFLIPIIFSKLTPDAQTITRNLVILVSCYMPVWTYINSQFAVSRAGGDTIFGVAVDVPVSLLLFAPIALILAKFTSVGPVAMFGIAKLTDFIKITIGIIMLRKERWVKKLTE